ncbi:MAG: thioesterase family protein, partial [Hyphomonadaceae bacterium]
MPTDTAPEPFLHRDGAQFVPTRQACGFWGPPDNFHARVMIGLFAYEIETHFGAPDFQPARLTVDLYRMPALTPVTVETRLIREGRRIKVIEAEIYQNGVSHARASCQLLRRTQAPQNPVWSPPPWNAPLPQDVPPPDVPFTEKWEMRPILPPGVSTLRAPGPRRTWLREVRPLIGGETHTPFTRIATGVDYTSPTA